MTSYCLLSIEIDNIFVDKVSWPMTKWLTSQEIYSSTNAHHFRSWWNGFWLYLGPSPPNHAKLFLKLLSMTIVISWPSFIIKWFMIQNTYSKYATLHQVQMCDVTTFQNDRMIRSTKKWNLIRTKYDLSIKFKFLNYTLTTFSEVIIVRWK